MRFRTSPCSEEPVSVISFVDRNPRCRRETIRPLKAALLSAACFAVLFVAFGAVADTEMAHRITTEDGFFEMLGAAAFLVVSVMQFFLYGRSRVGPVSLQAQLRLKRNVFHLLMGMVFFFGFAEEISWGQRFIGWETPVEMAAMNEQGETNIHNLELFHGESLLNMSRLFNLFWLSYCLLVPFSNRFVPLLRRLYRAVDLPVPALWVGVVFLSCYAVFRGYVFIYGDETRGSPNEIKESLFACCFVLLSVSQWARQKRAHERPPSRDMASVS